MVGCTAWVYIDGLASELCEVRAYGKDPKWQKLPVTEEKICLFFWTCWKSLDANRCRNCMHRAGVFKLFQPKGPLDRRQTEQEPLHVIII